MRSDSSSKFFHCSGYLSLREYVEDIESMRQHGPWRLPLGIGDRVQIFFFSLILKYSWFSDALSIRYPYTWSPAYSVLIAYLKRCGVVDVVREQNANRSGYSFFSLQRGISINENIRTIGGLGVDQEVSTAFSKAIGEMLERIISGLYNKDTDILIASSNELLKKFPVLYPPKYHRFLDIQREHYRELQHDPSRPMDWLSGINLITQEQTYIPRHIVSWFGFAEARVFKDILLHPTSNGCAGYFTKTGAVLRGLIEAVQRDAFLVHWLTQIAPDRIIEDTLSLEIQKQVGEFKARGITLHILDVTALSIPSVSIVAINAESETPQIILSGAERRHLSGRCRTHSVKWC